MAKPFFWLTSRGERQFDESARVHLRGDLEDDTDVFVVKSADFECFRYLLIERAPVHEIGSSSATLICASVLLRVTIVPDWK